MQSSLDYLFYASLFLLRAGVTGRITNPPQNTVSEVGSQAILTCTSDTTQQNWVFSKSREEYEASTGQIIAINCIVQTGFTTHYDVDRPGGSNNKCNLIVKATTLQQPGVYSCSDINSGPSAILTVIDRNALITLSSQPETVEGDKVTMPYTVRYNTSTASSKTPTLKPVLSWTDSDGNTVTSSPSSTANSVTSSISVTAGRQDIQPYTCHIKYEIKWPSPSTGLSFADNVPSSASDPPTTSTINVLYAPIISSITRSQSVCPGKTVEITCHATANPEPTYSWIGSDSRTYSGPTIVAHMNGTYTCNASNVIRGSTRSVMNETTLTVLCSLWFLLLLWLLNPIAAAIFVIHYKYSQIRNDYNKRYLFLNKMLPCMNNYQETLCRKVGWITLFIVMVIFSGIQFLILAIATYVGCKNKENGRVDGNGCDPKPRTNQSKYVIKSVDETAMQRMAQNTKQTKHGQLRDTKNEQWKSGKSTDQNQSTNFTSEEQSNSSQSNSSQSNSSQSTSSQSNSSQSNSSQSNSSQSNSSQSNSSHATENGRVDGNGCDPNPRTNQSKYVRKSVDQTATKQTKQEQVRDTKNEQWKSGKSTDQNQSTNFTSEEQSNSSHATVVGTRFQKICFACALGYTILGIILFAISVGVIYYECNRQCNKR